MVNKQNISQSVKTDNFQLRPLPACIRMAIAGSLFIGSVAPIHAELPVAANVWAGMNGITGGALLPQANDAATAATNQLEGADKLNINLQDRDRAILRWKSFNVGTGKEVEFHQKDASSIALNRIFQENPSQILGKVSANGQIYLYNQNGFVFGKDSTVNANTLVASTLNISEEALNKGIAQQFGIESDKHALGPEEGKPETATQANSFVRVNKGAKIHASRSVSKDGNDGNDGLIILAAPTVENKGSLSTDASGQIILVASQDKVYLQPADKDSPFAGLLVEVDTGGKVSNMGDILARQGNITLEGFAVNQGGRVTATTSVNVNGSIRLLANEGHGIKSGKLVATRTVRDAPVDDGLKLGTEATVTFAPGSVTRVIADESGGSAIDAQKQPPSHMDVIANKVHLKGADGKKPGSSIIAPGGNINVIATNDLDTIQLDGTVILPVNPAESPSPGRIIMDKGARINVSGTKHVSAAMERNVAEVSVQSFELRDSPLQKNGVLQGEKVLIDTRKNTKIIDTGGAAARIERSLKERLGKGGEINLISGGDVIVNNGAKINISGGSVDYRGGIINTTKLLTDYGRIVDISDADPSEHYVSIFGLVREDHAKWGVTNEWNILAQLGSGRFEHGYTEGQRAGALNIQTPQLLWNGDLTAGSSGGRYQREPDKSPFGGLFSFNRQDGGETYVSMQNIRFQTEKDTLQLAVNDKFPKQDKDNDKPGDLVLSQSLINGSGVQDVVIKTSGNVTVAEGAALAFKWGGTPPAEPDPSNPAIDKPVFDGVNNKPGGFFAVDAGSIDIKGNIYSPGGTINLATHFTPGVNEPGKMNLDKDSVLDVSGRWINDFKLGLNATPIAPLAIDGGAVELTSIGDLNMNSGAVIKADGGAWLDLNGNLAEGKGGAISLAAIGHDSTPSVLHPDGSLSAYGLYQNGTLTLSSGKVVVGADNSPVATTDMSPLVAAVNNGNFAFAPRSEFSKINLVANVDNLTVKGNARLKLTAHNRVLNTDYRQRSSAKSIADFTKIEILPEHLRRPVDLSLTGLTGVALETGSQITGDKKSSISLASSQGGIYVNGRIEALAGTIDLSIKADPLIINYNPTQSIWLGEHARLLARGTTLLNPLDSVGRRSGSVLDGGSVTLAANRGYVIQKQGAVIDVSGAQAVLDIPVTDASTGERHYTATKIGSNAGKVAVAAGEGVILDGQLTGFAGSETMRNGRLDVSLDRDLRALTSDSQGFNLNPAVIKVTQVARQMLDPKARFGNAFANDLNGQGTVSSELIAKGGFDDVRLNSFDEIRFIDDVNLTTAARLDINTSKIGWEAGAQDAATGGTVNLDTAYLKIGSELGRDNLNISGLPKTGAGTLTTHSQWTELVGATRWDGFKQINLNSAHDLRTVGVRIGSQRDFLGSLATAANLNLNASQIYPTTLTDFTFAVRNNPEGQITVTGNNTDVSPLSARGKLNFEAPVINQKGVLKAPFGTINLKAGSRLTLAQGSLTSVSADGQIIPFGITQGGLNWLYPLDSAAGNLVYNSAPDFVPIQTKQLTLKSPEITLEKGSVVDISGGGDLQAYEFQTGAGGSNDYLAALDATRSGSYQGGFAIVPGLGSALAPYDPAEQLAVANLSESVQANFTPGSSVYLSGTDKLPAGTYTILPPRYALLPGAFLVTPQANTQDQSVTTYTRDGLPIVAGYQALAGTGARDARLSGFLIEQGADIRKHSQYDEQTANNFFVQRALAKETAIPLIPMDSGQIEIDVKNKLILEGRIKSAPVGSGRGAKVDISADRIKVVTRLTDQPIANGPLEILARNLNELNLDSLLLGGTRTRDNITGETTVAVKSENVIFGSGINLKVKDLIAAATTKVAVKSGATLTASAKVNTGDSQLNVTGNGALLRVSGDRQINLNRTSASGQKGELLIETGATVKGANSAALQSVLLDASQSTKLAGEIQMQGGSLSLNANAINIGEVSHLTDSALNLSNQQLSSLSVDELQLNSRKAINFHGNVGQMDKANNLIPLQFDHLLINAAAFSGFGDHNTVKLQANNLQVQNSFGAQSSIRGTGNGKLELFTNNYTQGNGNFGMNGFNTVNINVAHKDATGQSFNAEGKSVLTVRADLNVNADYLTAAGGAHLKIDTTGHAMTMRSTGNEVNPVVTGFGGVINVAAGSIYFNARALLPSGRLGLQALTGDVVIDDKASIDLAGRAVHFADTADYTPGGVFSAVADKGRVTLAAGSALDISTGGGKAAGGKLILKAPEQTIAPLGRIKATAGSAEVDIARFDPSVTFDGLMAILNNAGISESVYFRAREADIVQASGKSINANTLTLVADKGAIDVSGTLNASGAKEGGSIALYAGDGITLQGGSQLTAIGTQGGKVLLSSVDSDKDNKSGIEVKAGSLINVSGATQAQGGKVTLRALRNDNGVNIQPVAGVVKGYSRYYAEGVKKYSNADIADGNINASVIARIKADTDSYMTATNQQNVSNRVDSAIRLRPGVEIDYAGDLILKDKWDFADWRYGDMTGNLVMNAGGKLTLAHSISDGFKDDPVTGQPDALQRGDSWSYQLASGADLSSADNFATVTATAAGDLKSGVSDLIIGSSERKFDNPEELLDVAVRTGSGDIQLAAGGNIIFKNQFATVYNAGQPDSINPHGTLSDYAVANFITAEYPVMGGNLVLKSANNIQGAVSSQFISTWLPRIGNWGDKGELGAGDSRTPTAWGVSVAGFRQNIGSFGGGKVDISASGNIGNLSVMMPTTGKQVGKPYADESNNSATGFPNYLTNEVQINGGGQLRVNAGGDIAGGAYYLGKGEGSVSADGAIKGGLQFVNGPQLVMGDSSLALNAGRGVSLTAVSDAMVLSNINKFYSYTDNSALTVKALSGDVRLGADTSVIRDDSLLALSGTDNSIITTVYPVSLQTTAFGGSIALDEITLFPSSATRLSLLAQQDIGSLLNGSIKMFDINMNLLPAVSSPQTTTDFFTLIAGQSITPPPILHRDDKEPARVVTQQGDIEQIQLILSKKAIIQAGRDLSNLSVAIQNINADDVSILSAGRDIRYNIELNEIGTLQPVPDNNKIEVSGPGEVLVKTGRNLDLGAANGLLTVGNQNNPNLPSKGANLTVLAGLNGNQPDYAGFIGQYLGDYPAENNFAKVSSLITEFMRQRLANAGLSDAEAVKLFKALNADDYASIQPQLNALIVPVYQQNPQLSYQGVSNADIIATLGGGASADYDSLIGKYLQHFVISENFNKAGQLMTDWMRQRLANTQLSDAEALAAFKTLKADDYLSIQQQLNTGILPVYFNEIKEAGSASAADKTLGNDRGFTAINTLFPGSELKDDNALFPWKGDVNLIFSTLQTQQGGDINLLAPGGQVNAGLAFAFPGLESKSASDLGIIAQKEGSINAVVRRDFAVNQSRVFAQNGGDIMIWSTNGDIDAGRGAKTALSVDDVVVNHKTSGKFTNVKPGTSGSGIRAQVFAGNISGKGDVSLFAPGGNINAGEAGIECNNCTFSAVSVLGSNNIQVGGIGTGVPAASVGSIAAGLTGVSNLTANVSQVAQASADMSKDSDATNKNQKLGILSVQILGFGENE